MYGEQTQVKTLLMEAVGTTVLCCDCFDRNCFDINSNKL